jgi:hypothetical protein
MIHTFYKAYRDKVNLPFSGKAGFFVTILIIGTPTIFAVNLETRFLGLKRPCLGTKPWLLIGLEPKAPCGKTWFLKKCKRSRTSKKEKK